MKKKGWNKRVFVAFLVIVMAAACSGAGVKLVRGKKKNKRSKTQMASIYTEKRILMNISKNENWKYGVTFIKRG